MRQKTFNDIILGLSVAAFRGPGGIVGYERGARKQDETLHDFEIYCALYHPLSSCTSMKWAIEFRLLMGDELVRGRLSSIEQPF